MWPTEAKITNTGQQGDAVHIMWREVRYLQFCMLYLVYREFWFLSLYYLKLTENQGNRLLHGEGTCGGGLEGRVSWTQSFRATRSLKCQRAGAQSEQFINCLWSTFQLPSRELKWRTPVSRKLLKFHQQLPAAPRTSVTKKRQNSMMNSTRMDQYSCSISEVTTVSWAGSESRSDKGQQLWTEMLLLNPPRSGKMQNTHPRKRGAGRQASSELTADAKLMTRCVSYRSLMAAG